MMLDNFFVKKFTSEWITAWNSHDVDAILTHYDEDFEMSSPVITQLLFDPAGTLRGKKAVKIYWDKILQVVPDLQFDLLSTFVGSQSITIYYKGARGRMSAEVFFFNAVGKISKAFAHYQCSEADWPG